MNASTRHALVSNIFQFLKRLSVACYSLFMLLNVEISHAQQLKLISTQFIGGTRRGSHFYDAVNTQDHGIAICGVTYDSASGDIPPAPISSGVGNILLVKLDSAGNKQWIKLYGTTGADGAKGICQTGDKGYALLTADSARKGDIEFKKLDSNGALLWSKSFGSSRSDGTGNIIVTADSGFLVFGYSMGADGDIPFNYTTPPVAFQPNDWVLIKTDRFGNKQWVKVLGTSGDEASGWVITDGKYYYLVASAITKDHDCVDSVRLHDGYTGYCPYIIKVDSSGNVLWSKAYGNGAVARAVFDPRDSTILGLASGGNGYEFQGNHGDDDMILFKVDRDGNFKWAQQYGDQSSDLAFALSLAPNGGYYVAGTSNDNRWTTTYQHIGNDDGWLFLVDSVGKIIAQKIFGNIEWDGVNAVVSDLEGVAVVGSIVGGSANDAHFTEGINSGYVNSTENTYVSHFQIWSLLVNQLVQTTSLSLYPNPAHQEVSIQLPANKGSGSITCVNTEGRVIYAGTTASDKRTILISTLSWPKGEYNICWRTDRSFQTLCSKLVVQ